MTTVGEQLLHPEMGWKRYDDIDDNISYIGTWVRYYDEKNYNGSYNYTRTKGDKIQFNFIGDKIRILLVRYSNVSNNITVLIDGIQYKYNGYGDLLYQMVAFEKNDLVYKEHYVEIISNIEESLTLLDAIDINDNGELRPYKIITNKYIICQNNSWYSIKSSYYNENKLDNKLIKLNDNDIRDISKWINYINVIQTSELVESSYNIIKIRR